MDMVQFIRDEIASAVRGRKIAITEIPAEEANLIRMDLIEKFCYGDMSARLAHCVHEELVHSEFSWRWVNDFVKDKTDVLLFFEKNGTLIMYRVHNGADIETILWFSGGRRMPMADFYLSHPSLDFVLYYAEDKTLNAAGTASEWLRAVQDEIYIMMGVSPAQLYISNVTVNNFGGEFTFDCLYSDQKLPVKLIFKGSGDIQWNRYGNGEVAKVRHIFLGRKCFEYAEFETDKFRIKFAYSQIIVVWN